MLYRLFTNDEEVGTLLDGQKFLDYALAVGSGGSSVEPYLLGTGSWNLVFEIPDLDWRFRVNESHGSSINWLLQGTGTNGLRFHVMGILDECRFDGARVEVVVRI
jgi:hypothetical protein